MVDHQVDRHQRVDHLRITTQPGHRGAHRRQVDHSRHPGEILHDHPRRQKRNARSGRIHRFPGSDIAHILLGDLAVIALSQGRFQQHANRKRQATQIRQPCLFQSIQAIVEIRFTVNRQFITGMKKIVHRNSSCGEIQVSPHRSKDSKERLFHPWYGDGRCNYTTPEKLNSERHAPAEGPVAGPRRNRLWWRRSEVLMPVPKLRVRFPSNSSTSTVYGPQSTVHGQ